MRTRKDGEETRQKILEAACEVFGEKGYHEATHAEICERAGVNTAAINYHFGSKDGLYEAVWKQGVQQADALYPLDGGLAPDAPAEDRLRTTVHSLLRRKTDQHRLGHFHSIRMMEMSHPSGLLDKAISDLRERARTHLFGILDDLLGPGATRKEVELCEMSIISQCLMAHGHPRRGMHGPPWKESIENLDDLADHIVRFSLAGIEAIRGTIQRREVPV
jgi:AcrR family transcriptional regulator